MGWGFHCRQVAFASIKRIEADAAQEFIGEDVHSAHAQG